MIKEGYMQSCISLDHAVERLEFFMKQCKPGQQIDEAEIKFINQRWRVGVTISGDQMELDV